MRCRLQKGTRLRRREGFLGVKFGISAGPADFIPLRFTKEINCDKLREFSKSVALFDGFVQEKWRELTLLVCRGERNRLRDLSSFVTAVP